MRHPARPATLETTAAHSFTPRDFRDAMGQFATGIVVIATPSEAGVHAMTANAFMSGSLDPFLVLVSIALTARMHDRLKATRRYGVSILGQTQLAASNHFGGRPVKDNLPTFEDLAGVPVLAGAAVRLAAEVRHEHPCGDHTLFVGEVHALEMSRQQKKPLLYYGGQYRHVAPPDWSAESNPQILWQENDFRY